MKPHEHVALWIMVGMLIGIFAYGAYVLLL